MAKKRRKRRPRRPAPHGQAGDAAAAESPKPGAPERQAAERRRAAAQDERPPAPWGSFPLVEIVVLVALVMLVAGFIVGGSRGTTLIVTGLVLGSLAGLELSIREHFAGYRSHTTLLAGAVAVLTMAIAYYALELAAGVAIAAGVAAGALAAVALVRAFRARAGRVIKLR